MTHHRKPTSVNQLTTRDTSGDFDAEPGAGTPFTALPATTVIGHVQLKATDKGLGATEPFSRDVLSLEVVGRVGTKFVAFGAESRSVVVTDRFGPAVHEPGPASAHLVAVDHPVRTSAPAVSGRSADPHRRGRRSARPDPARRRRTRSLTGLAATHHVLVPTHPGWEDTPRPGWFTGADNLVEVYLDLLDDLGLEDVTVIGSSFGGWLAAEIAVRDRGRNVSSLVLIDAIGPIIDDHPIRTPDSGAPRPARAPAPGPAPAGPPRPGNMAALKAYAGEHFGDPKLLTRLARIKGLDPGHLGRTRRRGHPWLRAPLRGRHPGGAAGTDRGRRPRADPGEARGGSCHHRRLPRRDGPLSQAVPGFTARWNESAAALVTARVG
ncbi:MAG: hypothetical protein QOI78_9161 [Actinomycetota bacterium]|nr:hypothetical protein [Actinomycetota bacterium]